jgi:hypothetical protein
LDTAVVFTDNVFCYAGLDNQILTATGFKDRSLNGIYVKSNLAGLETGINGKPTYWQVKKKRSLKIPFIYWSKKDSRFNITTSNWRDIANDDAGKTHAYSSTKQITKKNKKPPHKERAVAAVEIDEQPASNSKTFKINPAFGDSSTGNVAVAEEVNEAADSDTSEELGGFDARQEEKHKVAEATAVQGNEGAFPSWLHGPITTDAAAEMAAPGGVVKPNGAFLIWERNPPEEYTLTLVSKGKVTHHRCKYNRDASLWCMGRQQKAYTQDSDLESLVSSLFDRVVGWPQMLTEAISVPPGGVSPTMALATDEEDVDELDFSGARVDPKIRFKTAARNIIRAKDGVDVIDVAVQQRYRNWELTWYEHERGKSWEPSTFAKLTISVMCDLEKALERCGATPDKASRGAFHESTSKQDPPIKTVADLMGMEDGPKRLLLKCLPKKTRKHLMQYCISLTSK